MRSASAPRSASRCSGSVEGEDCRDLRRHRAGVEGQRHDVVPGRPLNGNRCRRPFLAVVQGARPAVTVRSGRLLVIDPAPLNCRQRSGDLIGAGDLGRRRHAADVELAVGGEGGCDEGEERERCNNSDRSQATTEPHPEERRAAARLEGWPQALPAGHPSRRAACGGAPQDEDRS